MWELPSVGDIVWCKFPQKPRDEAGPKPKPALVVAVNEYEDGIGIEVAYGTT
ncbi:type II toxin-antitoxin system PemK/MazF family toxin [Methylobacillus glycogenes]|uniref:type II toxin-antitoxin system PemK/MazF family toxin n=1 Tax=Methylobacillus glycogenes TaxID=406 RepID=UPI0011DD02FD|nr:type II toxin-antitoxin system PemK/MazF family toxin [Methylobacillus glycogenes]